ncbi:MAG: 4-hydroxy-3-methylbut-2-enyl diphosphate reductase [Candidatus Omnitrophica bacterium]|nr:4-hydroxy-3-methylbut-2-enyl diphosphate reductase [Candidatus Omnitrophota bacterium]
MTTKLAKRIGFCFGVRRAVSLAEAALKRDGEAHSLGSIIHNPQVVARLSKKGLKVADNVAAIKSGTVVVSSHGISPKISRSIKKRGLKLIDTTCPFVLNAQRIVRSLSGDGYKVIILGEARHPEVKALVDFASLDTIVVRDKSEASKLKISNNDYIGIISQTTQSTDNFLDVVETIRKKRPRELKIINTICKDVEERQRAARILAKKVDAMLIVGGKNSANTKRLFEICRKLQKNSHLVETEKEIARGWFKPNSIIGVTSGASTPDWLVKKVINAIREKGGCIING